MFYVIYDTTKQTRSPEMACLLGKRDDERTQTNGYSQQTGGQWKLNTTKIDRELKWQDIEEQRPVTCQLYPGLSATKLYNFLQTKSASKPCMVYYLRKLQNVKPNYIRDYLDRNGMPYNEMDKHIIHHDRSNNASFTSSDWMSIVSHSSTLEEEFDERDYYKIYYENRE